MCSLKQTGKNGKIDTKHSNNHLTITFTVIATNGIWVH